MPAAGLTVVLGDAAVVVLPALVDLSEDLDQPELL
jgi:hypothetical protein